MANLLKIVKKIHKERNRLEKQLSGLNAALVAFVGVYRGTKRLAKAGRKRRKLSVAGRKRIAAAQRARWAKVRKSKKVKLAA